jgi:hypothetical protein
LASRLGVGRDSLGQVAGRGPREGGGGNGGQQQERHLDGTGLVGSLVGKGVGVQRGRGWGWVVGGVGGFWGGGGEKGQGGDVVSGVGVPVGRDDIQAPPQATKAKAQAELTN